MDDPQRIVKCGNLSLHSPGGFFKKRWHSKYLVLYDGSKSGVKRLELFDSEIKFKKQNPARIIPLVDCVRVVTCQRHKTTYTFEVRTNDQFYLLAAQSFQDMNDWVNCLRLVAFGQSSNGTSEPAQLVGPKMRNVSGNVTTRSAGVDVLLDKRPVNEQANRVCEPQQSSQSYVKALEHHHSSAVFALNSAGSRIHEQVDHQSNVSKQPQVGGQPVTAMQAASAAANALTRTRQRQPSLLGSCKPQPPTDSPFIAQTNPLVTSTIENSSFSGVGQLDTLTPTVRGQLIAATVMANNNNNNKKSPSAMVTSAGRNLQAKQVAIPSILDEEEENMLYCSIEDNPSEHNYRVKLIETELSLRCQLKCYQLTAPTTVCQQYEQLGNFNSKLGVYEPKVLTSDTQQQQQQPVTFYQLIVGPQELTLLNDYAIGGRQQQQQGLWSWPYQCIRRYGFDKDNCFMFEAGRKCNSGPGQFIVQTPKAYNIYQDVVKFVNELRSLGNPEQSANSLPINNQESSPKQQEAANQVITQIPVTWSPNPNNATSIESTTDCRQQFFDTLRQLDTTTAQPKEAQVAKLELPKCSLGKQSPTTSGSSSSGSPTFCSAPPDSSSCKAEQQVIGKQLKHNSLKSSSSSSAVGTCEETDESGYEQGDDSVDSSTSRFKLVDSVGATRKRMANDSMSSSSSTSSGGDSPGQSVSRRTSGNVKHGQGPSKRPSLNKTTGSSTGTCNDKNARIGLGVHDLIAGSVLGHSDDFETSLIRDVYSEITKLHAKFAVTTTSGDDSMSNSSQEDSTTDNLSEPNGSATDYYVNDQNSDLSEPTYTNLKSLPQLRARARVNPENGLGDEIRGRPLGHQQYNNERQTLASNSYIQNNNNFDYQQSNGSLFPTVLNPIPECGEVTTPQVTNSTRSHSFKNVPKKIANPASHGSKVVQTRGKANEQQQNKTGLKSKQPTNHYVINDVQYAKITRNMGFNTESCL